MVPPARSLQDQALALCRDRPEGVTQAELERELQVGDAQLQGLINALLTRNLVEVHQRGDEYVFKGQDEAQAAKMRNLTREDHLLLQAIRRSGRQGIWTKDMRRETNLTQPAITKILKTLEERNLVKHIKSVNDGKRKIYVDFNVEPANELTGGLWYQGAEMDTEFISVLQKACQRFIAARRSATVDEVFAHIQAMDIVTVDLDVETIADIVRTLKYDGVVEAVPGSAEPERWRIAAYQVPTRTPFTAFPCGVCPVIEQCTPGGQISPETCAYWDKYLQF